MLWTQQRNENEKTQQVFSQQTARAENQTAATKQVEDKIKNCSYMDQSGNVGFIFNGCAYGHIYDVQEMSAGVNEPDGYLAFFSSTPDTFSLYGGYNPQQYIGDCVKVWGNINENARNKTRVVERSVILLLITTSQFF